VLDNLVAVAQYRQGPNTYYIKLSFETRSTSHSQLAQPSLPNPLDPQAAGELLDIFNNLLETGQVNNREAPVPGSGFLNQVREQELREQRLKEQQLKAKHSLLCRLGQQLLPIKLTNWIRTAQDTYKKFRAQSTPIPPRFIPNGLRMGSTG
jgi:hypothetical protein